MILFNVAYIEIFLRKICDGKIISLHDSTILDRMLIVPIKLNDEKYDVEAQHLPLI